MDLKLCIDFKNMLRYFFSKAFYTCKARRTKEKDFAMFKPYSVYEKKYFLYLIYQKPICLKNLFKPCEGKTPEGFNNNTQENNLQNASI